MNELIIHLGLLIGCGIASYTDLKKREVSDYLSAGLIVFGLVGYALISIQNRSLYPFIMSLVGFCVLSGISLIMFHTKIKGKYIWEGGDTKLMGAVGACMPYKPLFLYPFMAVLISGFIWGLIYYLVYKKKEFPMIPAFFAGILLTEIIWLLQ